MPKNKKGILMETFMGKWTVLLQLNMIHCFPIAINNDSLHPVLLNSRGKSFLGETQKFLFFAHFVCTPVTNSRHRQI